MMYCGFYDVWAPLMMLWYTSNLNDENPSNYVYHWKRSMRTVCQKKIIDDRASDNAFSQLLCKLS